MRISAKRTNLGKIMISRKKPISRVKKIIKNKTNKRKTKKMKKKHKKVKHKTTRKIRSMSRIGRRRIYHGGDYTIPEDEKDKLGEGSYGIVYVPNKKQPSWVVKLHEKKDGEGCEQLKKEYTNHEEALRLLKECKQIFEDIKLEIPTLKAFHNLTRSNTNTNQLLIAKNAKDYTACVYTMERIWPITKAPIKKLLKDSVEWNWYKGPTRLHLSSLVESTKVDYIVNISMFKNSHFAPPSSTSPIIKDTKIGFIELDQREEEEFDTRVYRTVFNWGYSMMLFYFYCAYNCLILRDSEFGLGQQKPTGRDDIHLFCYDFNQCRKPRTDDKMDTAKQYLHLSGMLIGKYEPRGGVPEEEMDHWRFMPIPTTSPIFFVKLVNRIFKDAKNADIKAPGRTCVGSLGPFHIYIKDIVDQILLWLKDVNDGTNWKKHGPFSQAHRVPLKNFISELFKMHNIQNHYYYSIQKEDYNKLDDNNVLKKAQMWTKDTDNQDGVFKINETIMKDYIEARKMKCQFGLDNLVTNTIELELEKIKQPNKIYFYNTKVMRTNAHNKLRELTFLVNINLDIEMQKTIIKKMVIGGYFKTVPFSEDNLEKLFSELRAASAEHHEEDSSSGFDKIIKMLDKVNDDADKKRIAEEEKEEETNLGSLYDGDDY
jgi:hypothetical protein